MLLKFHQDRLFFTDTLLFALVKRVNVSFTFFPGRPEIVKCNSLRALLAGRRRAYVCQRIISSFCVGTAIRRNYTSIVHEFQNTTFKMLEERSRENSDLADLSDVSALSDSSELSYSAVGHCDRRRYNRERTISRFRLRMGVQKFGI